MPLFLRTFLIISIILIGGVLLSETRSVHAREPAFTPLSENATTTPQLIPVITSVDYAPVGRTILFDASESTLLPDVALSPEYLWTFSDSLIRRTDKEVIRAFDEPGKYNVTLTIRHGTQEARASKDMFVYDQRILLITDKTAQSGLEDITTQAAENGVLLETIEVPTDETGFITEEGLVKIFAEKNESFSAATVIFYTKSHTDLAAFTRYWQNLGDDERKKELQSKQFIAITDDSIGTSVGIVLQSFKVIKPSYILLTRPEALSPIFESKDLTTITDTIDRRGIEYRIIDERSERSGFFLLSRLITNFVSRGIPSNVIFLILAFPFIALIIAFAREILGISAFGVYTPATIAIAFLILGLELGLATLAFVIIAGSIIRWVINKLELLYIPRTALVLSLVTLSFLSVIWALQYVQSPVAISLAIFPMLVMSTVTEKFLSAQQEEGIRFALLGVLQTVGVVVASYYAVTWEPVVNVITATPEYVLLPIALLLLIGKFTGLRLTEYIRFRSLFKSEGAEEE